MCGIVGAIGERNIVPVLIEGLKRLEYRGYDSAGVSQNCLVHSGSGRGAAVEQHHHIRLFAAIGADSNTLRQGQPGEVGRHAVHVDYLARLAQRLKSGREGQRGADGVAVRVLV